MRSRFFLALALMSLPAMAACQPKGDDSRAAATAKPAATTATATPTRVASAGSSGAVAMHASTSGTATQSSTEPKGNGNLLQLKRPAYDKKNANWKFGVQDPGTARFDAKKDYFATIHTTLGDITVKFYPEVAPHHVTAFINLSELGYYDDAPFHRIIPGFMMQGGDPSGQGNAGPMYHLGQEFSVRKHVRGTLSMARVGRDLPGVKAVDSAGSQFYICFRPAPSLDGQYTVFGEVVKGLDVVDKFEAIGSGSGRPSKIEKITSVEVSARDKT